MGPSEMLERQLSASSAGGYPSASTEYHLSAVNLTFNHIPYCIIGTIDFDFRAEEGDDTVLTKIRLAPLIGPESQDSATNIDVIFCGRWRKACAFLRKRDVVCISRAQVAPAADVEVHESQLVMRDPKFENPPTDSRALNSIAAKAALFVLVGEGGSRRPKFVVSFHNLNSGRVPVDVLSSKGNASGHAGPDHENPRAPKVARTISNSVETTDAAVNAAAAAAAAPVRTNRNIGRAYKYKNIEELWDELESSSKGGLGDCHVYGIVIDARAPSTTHGPDLKSDVTIVDETSFRGGGAAMEAKTLCIHRFNRNPRNGIPYRAVGDIIRGHRLKVNRYDQGGRMQAQGAARAFSTFLLWTAEGEDFKPIEDRGPTHGPGAGLSPTHTMTDYDRARIAALRAYSKRYISGLASQQRPFLQSVASVVDADLGERWLTQSFDLLALYTPSTAAAVVDRMNGTVRFSVSDGRPYVHRSIRIESVVSDTHRTKAASYRFVDFISSFHHRPGPNAPPRWLLIRDAYIRPRSAPGAPREVALKVQKHSTTLIWLPDYAHEVRAHLQRDTDGQPESSSWGGQFTDPQPPQRNNTAQLTQLPSRMHLEDGLERARIDRDLAKRWETLGRHNGMHLPVCSVRSVMQAALNGSKKAMRVQAKVRGWVSPVDVRFTARPFCAPCREFVARRSAACDTCGSRLGWAFLVRLKLGDDDGCLADAWLTAEHAEKFFAPRLVPHDLTHDVKAAQYVHNVAVALMKSNIRLDCLVQPYVAESVHGVARPFCRIVHTNVKLDCIK